MVHRCRRNPKLAAVSAAAGLVILTLSGIFYATLLKENANTRAALKREQEARAASDLNSYAANLSAAVLYLRSNSIADAEQRLSVCNPGLRGKVISIWEVSSGKLLRTVTGHDDKIRALAFSPDGSRLIAGVDTTVKIWDAPSLTPLLTIPAHDGTVESVSFSPDGSMLLSVGNDGKAKTWKSKRRN